MFPIKDEVDATIQRYFQQLRDICQKIHSNPELAWTEKTAHDTICAFLDTVKDELGLNVTRHAYGLETAFEATYGSGGGRLANFNAEYDALPDIGHACGHNLIATSSIAAFLGLTVALKKAGIPGRTQLLGTPAEELGGGKITLLEKGAFEGVDVSLMGHPGPTLEHNGKSVAALGGVRSAARLTLNVEFKGRPAHAGFAPWLGHNALDAFVAAYSNISLLRQQLMPHERVSGCILEAPKVSNIIPDYVKASFDVRTDTLKNLNNTKARIKKCLEAGAVATGCEVIVEEDELYADLVINRPLCKQYAIRMAEYGETVQDVLEELMSFSTDQGNVMHEVPGMHCMFGIPCPKDSGPHHRSFQDSAGKPEAFDCCIQTAKGLALLGWDCLTDDEFYKDVRKDFDDMKLQES